MRRRELWFCSGWLGTLIYSTKPNVLGKFKHLFWLRVSRQPSTTFQTACPVESLFTAWLDHRITRRLEYGFVNWWQLCYSIQYISGLHLRSCPQRVLFHFVLFEDDMADWRRICGVQSKCQPPGFKFYATRLVLYSSSRLMNALSRGENVKRPPPRVSIRRINGFESFNNA